MCSLEKKKNKKKTFRIYPMHSQKVANTKKKKKKKNPQLGGRHKDKASLVV